MIGVLVNTATVIVGSLLGLLFRKGINEKFSSVIMAVIGLCVIVIGVQGAIATSNAIIMILSLVIGTILGMLLHIGVGIDKLGAWIEKRFTRTDEKASIAQGFISGSLLFCVGGMTIVGSLTAGIEGNNDILFAKSILDLISSCVLASTLGFGVLLSAVFVFLAQGALVLLSGVLGGLLNDAVLVAEISAVGGIMMIALGLNLAKITKIQVADMLPAFLIVPAVNYLLILIGV
ncbi:MAG: DUF554 domain-containing protein [Clostridia bacterium]|nr:DUF554 domain-containing protein [Clostridia bacterium]